MVTQYVNSHNCVFVASGDLNWYNKKNRITHDRYRFVTGNR